MFNKSVCKGSTSSPSYERLFRAQGSAQHVFEKRGPGVLHVSKDRICIT